MREEEEEEEEEEEVVEGGGRGRVKHPHSTSRHHRRCVYTPIYLPVDCHLKNCKVEIIFFFWVRCSTKYLVKRRKTLSLAKLWYSPLYNFTGFLVETQVFSRTVKWRF